MLKALFEVGYINYFLIDFLRDKVWRYNIEHQQY